MTDRIYLMLFVAVNVPLLLADPQSSALREHARSIGVPVSGVPGFAPAEVKPWPRTPQPATAEPSPPPSG